MNEIEKLEQSKIDLINHNFKEKIEKESIIYISLGLIISIIILIL